MPALAPAVAEPLRPVRVFTYAPSPPVSKPRLPDVLVEMFWRELSEEPHHNEFFCDKCHKEYPLVGARAEGTTCTQRPEGGFVCTGTITRRWTMEKAKLELCRIMGLGGVAIAWELTQPSIPVAFAVCEAHRSDSVIHTIDFPMTVLSTIYGRFERDEPFLVITHLSTVGVAHAQRAVVVEKLIKDAVESMMGLHHLPQATILIPVSTQGHSPERQALSTMLGSKQVVLVRDARNDRHRELWGFKLRSR